MVKMALPSRAQRLKKENSSGMKQSAKPSSPEAILTIIKRAAIVNAIAFAALISIALLSSCTKAPDLVLWEKGTTNYQIVLPQPSDSKLLDRLLLESAEVIQGAFAAGGTPVELVIEGKHDPERPGIYLGGTEFARNAGIDFEDLEGWSSVIRVVGPNLIIAGKDIPHPLGERKEPNHLLGVRVATTKGVTEFLRNYAGTRFVYPGKIGIEYQDLARLAVPSDLDVTIRPMLRYNFTAGSPGTGSETGANGLFDRGDLYRIANNYFPNIDFDFTIHSWDKAIPVEKFRKSNPEYFAMIKGKRTVEDPDRTTLVSQTAYNLGNPEVRERIYQFLLDSIDSGYEYGVVGQQDGFLPCESEESRALYGTGDNWREKIWQFNREIAERLAKDRPGAKVIFSAYGETSDPPESFDVFPENSVIMLTKTDEETIAKWKQKEVPGGFTAYVYNWGTYHLPGYTPNVTPEYIEKQVRRLVDLGTQGIFSDGFGYSYGLDGPTYYIFGRLFEDPDNLDAGQLLNEFCDAAFGSAAKSMEDFYRKLYGSLEEYRKTMDGLKTFQERKRFTSDALRVFAWIHPENSISELEKHLARAEQEADSEKARVRLGLVRLEFEYLKRMAIVANRDIEFRDNPSPRNKDRLLDAADAWNEHLDAIYGDRESPAYIPGFVTPYSGHVRRIVGMTVNNAYRAYADTSLNWNTAEMRRAPLPGSQSLEVFPGSHTPVWDAPEWNSLPSTSLGESATIQVAWSPGGVAVRFDVPVAKNAAEDARFEVVLDPEGLRQKYFRFLISPDLAVKTDAAKGLVLDNLDPRFGLEDPTWTGEWQADSKLISGRWQGVLFFPYTTLGVEKPTDGTVWRANFSLPKNGDRSEDRPVLWVESPEGGSDAITRLDHSGELTFRSTPPPRPSP